MVAYKIMQNNSLHSSVHVPFVYKEAPLKKLKEKRKNEISKLKCKIELELLYMTQNLLLV